MIIKKLNLISFGKFKNKVLDLEAGLNIIYGENEAGKSTIQGFIKSMLYGMNSQKKSIKDNDRKKFLPWGMEKAQGEMILEDENRDSYIIKKSFGSTKKEDEGQLIEYISGNIISEDVGNIGRKFLGLNDASFEKTLFIKQLGSEISRGKEDEIMQKLTNLEQGADENISYHKVIKLLEDAKKGISTSRKTGQLDNLRRELEVLNIEYTEILVLSEENIENQVKLNEFQYKKKLLLEDINKLEFYKKHIKRIKLNKEYKEITEYLKKSNELTKQKELVDESLDLGDVIIDENYIDIIKQEYSAYKQLLSIYNERNLHNENIQSVIHKKEEELEAFQNFLNLDEEVDRKVIELDIERKNLYVRYEALKECERELQALETEFKVLREEVKDISVLEDIRPNIDKTLYEYEEKLKEVKNKLDTHNINYNILSWEEVILNSLKKNKLIMLISYIVFLVDIIFIYISRNNKFSYYLYCILIPLLAAILIYTTKFRSLYKQNLVLIREKEKEKDIRNSHEDLAEIEDRLLEYYKAVGVKDYKDFILVLKKYDIKKMEIERLKIKIEEKLIQKENYQEETLIESLNRTNKYIDFILRHTKSKDVEEFLNNHKVYKSINSELEALEIELESHKHSISHIKEEINIKKNLILGRLKKINNKNITIEEVEEEVERIYDKLKEKRLLEKQLEAIESNYRLLLKDRDLSTMQQEIGDMLNSNVEEDFRDEEALDETLKDKNAELLNTEKAIKDVQHSIEHRFLGKRRLDDIEEDIERVKEEIDYLEETLEVINISYEVIVECFKELQKNFGPILNEKVAEIFSNLTGGKYEELKISENYSVKVRDYNGQSIVEAEYLSNGTVDQIYFSLRMALIDLIYPLDQSVPIILDDAFIQYDDERMKKALEYLYKVSRHRQIIIFTCQKREVNILSGDVNIINL